MAFSRFRIYIVVQVIFIALTSFAFFWTTQQEYMLITSSSLAILWILQIIYLIWYLQKVNRDIIKFVTALKYDDVSINFQRRNKVDKAFRNLYDELNHIIKEISVVRLDKESEHQYFQNTIKHIGIGILAFDEKGKVEICNDAALSLLNRHSLNNISDTNKTQEGLSNTLINLKPGNTKLIKLNINNEIIQLSVKAAKFIIKSREIKLLSLQNIKSEIDKSEVEAWQKLIRVLTHEIMNSVSPIKLLSGSLIEMFENEGKVKTLNDLDNPTIENSVLGLKTIRKRSIGLSNFVETYKSLTQIPKPKFTELEILSLFQHLNTLLNNDLNKNSVQFEMECIPRDITINADEKLIEQVLINLIKNSMEALQHTKNSQIKLVAELVNDQVQIKISDNGPGMNPEIIENIFIPFFTTKEKGSGIGLSLFRQIMHSHGGNISVKSELDVETSFTLTF